MVIVVAPYQLPYSLPKERHRYRRSELLAWNPLLKEFVFVVLLGLGPILYVDAHGS